MQDKRCPRCGEIKDISEFCKNKSNKDGLSYYCRACGKSVHAKWVKENPEKAEALKSKWYKENHEKAIARDAKWRAENPEKVKAQNAKYRAANQEKVKAIEVKWKKNNPEKISYSNIKYKLKRKIGETPPPELVEIKVLINQIKKGLCKTSKN